MYTGDASHIAAHTAQFIAEKKLLQPRQCVVVAISGGLDSMVLAHVLQHLGYRLVLAHCNFQLRGAESLRDEAFVQAYADQLGCPLALRRFDTQAYAAAQGLSIQEAARQLRYAFFEEVALAQPPGPISIATAHHAQDVAETFLMHAARGTGLSGLKSIPVRNGKVVRPLWWASRAAIEAYAQAMALGWVHDSSNDKDAYARNAVRHHVLPALEQPFPQALAGILHTVGHMQQAHLLYHERVQQLLRKGIRHAGTVQKVPVAWLQKQPAVDALLWEWLHPFGFTAGQVAEVHKLMQAHTGSSISSAAHRLLYNRQWLELSPLASLAHTLQVVAAAPAQLWLGGQAQLHIQQHSTVPGLALLKQTPPHQAWLDADKLQWPLVVRPWKPGDYLYPLGMGKKKKVARLLIDAKLSATQKEAIWVVESAQRIVWVAGIRVDARFAIGPGTAHCLHLRLLPTSE